MTRNNQGKKIAEKKQEIHISIFPSPGKNKMEMQPVFVRRTARLSSFQIHL